MGILPDVPGVVFKFIAGFERYAVGDDGSVWTLCGKKSKVPAPLRLNRRGRYLAALLHGKTGPKRDSVHRLVLEAFVGPCPEGMQGCHNNGNPHDNRLSNLRWDTPKGNYQDRVTHGTALLGTRNHRAALEEDDVHMIRMIHDRYGTSAYMIGKALGFNKQAVQQVIDGTTWKHLN